MDKIKNMLVILALLVVLAVVVGVALAGEEPVLDVLLFLPNMRSVGGEPPRPTPTPIRPTPTPIEPTLAPMEPTLAPMN